MQSTGLCTVAYFGSVLVREEGPADQDAVRDVHRVAFGSHGNVVLSLVEGLRRSLAVEQGLSLVAVDEDNSVVGHVMFTRNLLDAPLRLVDIQVLSPLAVMPALQGQGVGRELIRHGLGALSKLDVPAVFLEGSPAYYSRNGFVAAGELGFRRPSLRIPQPAFQVCVLPAYASWMTGTLVYRQDFWDHDAVGLRDFTPT
jgi:putative acetyltransferase